MGYGGILNIPIVNEGVYARLYDTDNDGVGDTLVLNNKPSFSYSGTLINKYNNKNVKYYTESRPIWYSNHNSIKKVEVLNNIKPTFMESWFEDFSNLTTLTNFSKIDTSKVTTFEDLFYNCSSLTSIDLTGWDTKSCTDFSQMFRSCSSLTTLTGYTNWNTSNVTSFDMMFLGCSQLAGKLTLSNWNTSKVTLMRGMFSGCRSLTQISTVGWDTSNVTDMSSMFERCTMNYGSTGVFYVGNFNVSKVKNFSLMFSGCTGINGSLDLSKWRTPAATNMQEMFALCSNMTMLDMRGWDTSKVTNMTYMFYDDRLLKSIIVDDAFSRASLQTSNYEPFYNCVALYGGSGTAYDSSASVSTQFSRMRIDNNEGAGYLTYIQQFKPNTYSLYGTSYIYKVQPNTTVSTFSSNCSLGAYGRNTTYWNENETTQLSNSSILKTGDKMRISVSGTVIKTFTIIVRGDVDKTGLINATDLSMVSQHVAGTSTLTGIQFIAGDCDYNGVINSTDTDMVSYAITHDQQFPS